MNSKTKMRLFNIAELIVWLLIIIFCVVTITVHHARKVGSYATYRIFLQDVDGLIEGSSVRMMGVPIGYIKTISIVQDQVYIKFVITDKDVKLPQGVIATVEFNGMAGSKSLELYSPDEVSVASGKLVTIKRTNRLGAALGLFDDMFAKFDSILVRCDHFSNKLSEIMPTHQTVSEEDPIIEANRSLGSINVLIETFDKKRSDLKKIFKPLLPKNSEGQAESQTVEEGSEDE